MSNLTYCTRTIINRGLYIFYPIFHCDLYCRVVSVKGNQCTKQENLQFLSHKSAAYNQERFLMAHVRYSSIIFGLPTYSTSSCKRSLWTTPYVDGYLILFLKFNVPKKLTWPFPTGLPAVTFSFFTHFQGI